MPIRIPQGPTAPTASVALILRTSNIQLPYGATISNIPLSAEKMDNNFISNQNIFIPQPQIHINGGGLASSHINNNKITISGHDSLQESLNNGISLYWNGSDKTFLDHDPHFFLFRHSNRGSHHRQSTKGKAAGPKQHSGFVHPSHGSDPMFNNFSAGNGDWGNTEWSIKDTKSSELVNLFLEADNYYRINGDIRGYLNNHFFPRTITSWNNDVYIRGNKGKKLSIKAKKVVLSFAIVIRDPKNPARYIIGPMSKTLIITPKIGVFQIPGDYINGDNTLSIPNSPNWDLGDTTKHVFYGWKAYTK